MTAATSAPVALTEGEPAGIGPEIAAAAWLALRSSETRFLWIGDPAHLGDIPFQIIDDPAAADAAYADALPVLPMDFGGPRTPGQPQPAQAQPVIDAIARAVDLAQNGAVSAICTAPIHKKALIDGAGFAYPGHTEYLAALAGVDHVVMMLASDTLRVVPTTIHVPLSAVPGLLTEPLLERVIRITHAGLVRDFGLTAPRLAVAGLNPHAGEGGAMGHEDAQIIALVIARLQAEGMAVTGPHSADTLFHATARARYDAAICMYHDQALIPIKTLDFDRGVNVTLGLPFIRTSPDHGTAFDIAGKAQANPTSLIEALRLAHSLAQNRQAAP